MFTFNKPNNIIVFIGESGVGKTFLALNTAFYLQKKEKKILLIDGNFFMPNLEKVLPLGPFFSFENVLKQKNTLNQFIQSFGEIDVLLLKGEYLDLKPFLNSFMENIAILSFHYDYVIIDLSCLFFPLGTLASWLFFVCPYQILAWQKINDLGISGDNNFLILNNLKNFNPLVVEAALDNHFFKKIYSVLNQNSSEIQKDTQNFMQNFPFLENF